MTTHSMQDIVQVENELHANEQAERKKAAAWLAAEKAAVQAACGKQREELEKQKDTLRKQAKGEGEQKAADIIRRASEHAARLDQISDKDLRRCLGMHLIDLVAGKHA